MISNYIGISLMTAPDDDNNNNPSGGQSMTN